ncbi:MAG: hypothetical protein PUP91_34345 [Rhizonema sp. PD37]|nr:hypothetical protein [Rhizonema sp. PD37]
MVFSDPGMNLGRPSLLDNNLMALLKSDRELTCEFLSTSHEPAIARNSNPRHRSHIPHPNCHKFILIFFAHQHHQRIFAIADEGKADYIPSS